MKKVAVFVCAVVQTHHALAYEIDTHSRITQFAYVGSTLDTAATQVRLGLHKSRAIASGAQSSGERVRLHLGQKYYDPLKVGGPDRYATAFDAENRWVMKAYRAPKPQRRWFYSQFDGRDEPYFPVDWMAQALICGMIAA